MQCFCFGCKPRKNDASMPPRLLLQEKKIVSCNFTVVALSRNARLQLMRFWNIFSRGGFHPSNSLAIRETQNFSSPLQTPLQILKSPTGTAALFSLTSERRSYTVTDLLIFKLSRIKKCAIWRRDLDYDYYLRMHVYILYSVNFRFGAGGRRRSINLYEVAY